MAIRVGHARAMWEKDTDRMRDVLMEIFNEWVQRESVGSNSRLVLAEKLRTIGLHSQAHQLLNDEFTKCT